MRQYLSLQEIVLQDDEPVVLEDIREGELSDEENRELGRLADVTYVRGRLLLTAGRRQRVGRTRIRHYVITVPAPMPPAEFVDFVLYAAGLDLHKFVERRPALVDVGRRRKADIFLALLANLQVASAEKILRQQVAREYTACEDRQRLLRGRPIWAKDFGRHPAEGITCRYRVLDTDNLFNRLVLTGLEASASILAGSGVGVRASNQVFIWRSLATSTAPKPTDYEYALGRLNRLTEHYRPVLVLSQTVVFGLTPLDVFAGSQTPFQTIEFSLPFLYERFVARFLSAVIRDFGLTLTFREEDRRAILDARGETYRRIEPDFVLFRGRFPVAVIDAKFKPRYVLGRPASAIPRQNRVTTDDIFQVFFYQARLQARYLPARQLLGAILAPCLQDSPVSDLDRRTITWSGDDPSDIFELRVLPLHLPLILEKLRDGTDELGVLHHLPELKELLLRAHTHGASGKEELGKNKLLTGAS